MSPPAAPSQDDGPDARWRGAGERIQTLLDASAAGGAVAAERAEQLVREITDLYGAALAQMMATVSAAGPELTDRVAADDLVASLLLVHGLHPHDTERRVADALDTVRPYLGSHGGDVTLLGVVDGRVRLQLRGNCKSCPSSSVTLELAVEDAVRAAAPEITGIDVVTADTDAVSGVIPTESLLGRVRSGRASATAWQPVPELAGLGESEVGGFRVASTTALACRIGSDVFAYRDRCAACAGSMAGARLSGSVLRCPSCGAAFDVVHAGVGVGGDTHLEPIPVLERQGVLSMAVATSAEVR